MFEPTAANMNMSEWAYCHALCTERGWVKRRVDKIIPLNNDAVRVHSSFDINTAKLQNIVDQYLPYAQRNKRIPVPIMLRTAEPILNIDVTLNGSSQSIAGRSASARYAQCAILHHVQKTIDLSSVDDFWLLSNSLFEWIRTGDSSAVDSALEDASKIENKINDNVIDYQTLIKHPVDIHTLTYGWLWSDILEDNESRQLIRKYANSHLVVIYLDKLHVGNSTVLKVTQDVPIRKPIKARFFNLMGARYPIPNVPLGSNLEGRYHLKIESPDELYVSSLEVTQEVPNKAKVPKKDRKRINLSNGTRVVSTRNMLEIHDGKDARDDAIRNITVHFESTVEVFTARALAIVILLAVYLFLINWVAVSQVTETAAIAVTIGAIAVTMPMLFRGQSESLFVAQVFQFDRGLLGAVIVGVLITGILHSISATPNSIATTMFIVASIIIGLYFILLIISPVLSFFRLRRFKKLLKQHQKSNKEVQHN